MEKLEFFIRRPSTGKMDLKATLTEDYAKQFNVKELQLVVITMIRYPMLGSFAVRQPADFYIDTRVGSLPYPRKLIYRAVNILQFVAKAHGLDPHNLVFETNLPLGWLLEP